MYGDTRDEYQELLNVYWPIGVGVFLVVLALVVFVTLRYRSSKDEWPKGEDSRTRAEGTYVLLLGGIAAALLYFTYTTMADIEPVPAYRSAGEQAEGELVVDVTAAKWNWRFSYPEFGIVEQGTATRIATLIVPEGVPIRFNGTSRDVIHSFFVPHLRFKRDTFPGRTTTWILQFPEARFFRRHGECAEFCGLEHADMQFNVLVLEEDEFRAFTRRNRGEVFDDADEGIDLVPPDARRREPRPATAS